MIKKLFTILFILVTVLKLSAQVNLQSGSAIFSLPMFSWQDDKSRLNSEVSLNYNSGSGLKVNDVASNIGQGWNLLAGGSITRIQAGEPDDQKPRDGAMEDINKYPPGFLYDTRSASLGAPGSLAKYPIFKDKNHIYKQHNEVAADKELDHFAFQFNGRSGIFILNKDTSNTGVFLGQNKLKVWFTRDENMYYQGSGIRTTITAFYIQDENGLIYKFTQHELTQVLKTDYCDANLNTTLTQPKFKINGVYHEISSPNPTVNKYIINGWHLTEIEDALTHRKILLNYITRNIDATAGTSITNYTDEALLPDGEKKNYSILSHARSITKTPAILSIAYPDGHQVIFIYDKARFDLNGDSVLSSIDIKYQNRYLAKYVLKSSYFILNRYGIPSSDYEKQCSRLCLKSIQKIGVDLKASDPPYTFDYYLGSSAPDDFIPPPFCHLKDIWGFYNGDYSKAYGGNSINVTTSLSGLSNLELRGLCFQRYGSSSIVLNAKPGYGKNGLLRQITYPTGGSLNYEFDQNVGILRGETSAINVGGVHVSKTTLTDGGYSNPCNHPISTSYSYTLEGSVQPSLWGLEKPVNFMTSSNHYAPEYKYFYYKPLFDFGCDYHFKYPGILSREQAINLTSTQNILVALSKVLNIVGNITQVLDIITYLSTPAGPGAVIIDAIVDVLNIFITCIGDHHKDYTYTISYNSDLNSSNPLPSQFKRVEVIGGIGSAGKTVYEFTSEDDFPIWEPQNILYSAKQRFAYWTYGLVKKTTIYDAAAHPVKQTENKYNDYYSQTTLGYLSHGMNSNKYTCCKSIVFRSSSIRSTDWDNPSNYNDLSSYVTDTYSNPDLHAELYLAFTGRVELDSVIERTYKQSDPTQFLENKIAYSYNDNYLVNEVTTIQSNGDVNYKHINYNTDYNGSVLNTLSQNNIFNVPVETTTSVGKVINTYTYSILSEKVTEFTSLSNGDIKPSRILEQRFAAPESAWDGIIRFYQGPDNANNPVYKEVQTFTYDAASNLTGIRDEGNHVVKNVYGYDDKYVIASVVNADPVSDLVAYSSFEGSVEGGWLTIGGAQFNTSSSITGSSSLSLDPSHSLWTPLNNTKPYRVSLWATSIVNVSNSSLVKSGPTINGYTYYEYSIPSGTSIVSVGGNATIDELRLYHQSARMRTVTYDPLIGKTSECDENNRITYFEYDDHARLQFIKDENRNVVKMYEYNIAKRPSGCPVTYFNYAVSEIFIKNNCPAGYVGNPVTYTIPEGTFTSITSQDAVDLQVQNQLSTYGQTYANTYGSCTQVFSNTALSQTFAKEGCDIGYVGTSIYYSVPDGKYTSLVSQADADEQAQNEMDANGQAFANLPGNTSCIISNTAVWIGTGSEQCQNGHKLKQVIDQNPNSSSYNQTQWIDTGEDADCSYNSGTCYGEGYAWINGTCEYGMKVYMGDVYDNNDGLWHCLYHYEFSDGSWSQDYEDPSGSTQHYMCLEPA
ncbi:MAG TPA: DUF5977 domain-containing protein [Chitinophagaceae bacterium]